MSLIRGSIAAAVLLVTLAAGVIVGDALWSPVPRSGRGAAVEPSGLATMTATGVAGGKVPEGGLGIDARHPAVTGLDPSLRSALRAAARDARSDGIEIVVNSGWRSAAYQEQLLDDAVATYGSRKEAARWVATAKTSAHVSGDAVDLGPAAAQSWLADHGSDHGLCRIYRNEPWHFELRPDAIDQGCPTMYADPTKDPRMGG